mgnify:CR=1 FL=1
MKILRQDVKHGRITVMPEMLDDLWVLYNVIMKRDLVYAKTAREVRLGERYDRPEKGKRISVFLGVEVQKVGWDRSLNRLRVHGIVRDAPDEIGAKGSHHTLNVTLNKPLTIVKDKWLKYQLDRLERATRTGISPVIIVSIDDERCCIAVLRNYRVDVKAEEPARIPGKLNVENRTKAFQEFFKSVLKSLREVWSEGQNPIVLIGVGFTKNRFLKFLKEKAPDLAQNVMDVKSVNNSGLAGINEALRSGILAKALKDLRISQETAAVEEMLSRLGRGKGDVTYGFEDVQKACTMGAVSKLLLTDTKLREASDEERTTLEELMREVEKKGGRILIISTCLLYTSPSPRD